MDTMQKVVLWLASGVFLAFSGQPVLAGEAIDIATAYGPENFHTQNLQQFAGDARTLSGGQVNFRIHSGGALLKPTDIYSGVRAGHAGAGEVVMSSLSKENVMFGIDALPFIVSGYDDARRMWEASRPAIEKLLRQQGLQLLYAVPWPPQNLYSRREIGTMKDFKGMNMRSYSPATERIAELVGAKPITIQSVDLTKAIAEEKLDLMITSSSTGIDTKAWSTLKHYYRVTAWIPKNMVFMNKKLFDSLKPVVQKSIIDAAHKAEERGWRLSQENNRSAEAELAANRIQVSTIDFVIRSYLDRIGESLAREWLKKAGADELGVLLRYTTERSSR
jgi:TRAP-type transport system periplasmic protein